jgi:beta-glucosidase
MKIIGSPLDFVGLNLYSGSYVRADSASAQGYSVVTHQEGYPRMDSPWLYLVPQVLYWGPRLAAEEWGVKALYITENGCSCKDKLTLDKQVLDTDRVMYLRNYLTAAQRATAEGYPLKGYFLWSLLDNFEWAEGYTKRFGITYVNYETLERIPKLSAIWYRNVIAANRVL